MEDAQLSSVFSNQLEKQIQKVKCSIKNESKRYERLSYQLSLTNHQLSLYSQESSQIQEKLQSSFELLTKELCSDLRQIKAPVSVILDICDKLLLVLGIKDRSWKSFRNLSKNFSAFKNQMQVAQTEQLPENIINEVLPLWKNQSAIRSKLLKINLASCLILDWVVHLIELNVKTEIIFSSKKRIPELKKMIKRQSKTLSELTLESVSIEEMMNKTKQSLEEIEQDACSELSLTSKPYTQMKGEERVVFYTTVHRGTASGGILHNKPAALSLNSGFPNFNSDRLYGEVPVDKHTESEPIHFEGKSEAIGCCRMNFFCF